VPTSVIEMLQKFAQFKEGCLPEYDWNVAKICTI